MHQLLLNLETVTVCNHWNLLEYNYSYMYICRRVKCIPFNCSLNRISSNHNMSRIQLRQSLTCTFRPVRRYINRLDGCVPVRIKPRGEFLSFSWTRTKYTSIVHIACQSSSLQKNFKVYDILKLAIVEQSGCNSACIGRSMHSQTIHI